MLGGLNIRGVLVPTPPSVYGLQSLRVVDASLLPLTVRGNIHLTVLMRAEKLSDAIKAEYASAGAAVVESEEGVARAKL